MSLAEERRHETDVERLDRNLEELTGELRVIVTGVQVLFAFLLVVPFDGRFAHAGDFERAAYVVTLALAAGSAVCMIAPSARHRFLFRREDKRDLVFGANRVVIVGLVLLALAMCGSILLATAEVFGVLVGALVGGVATIPFAALWFASRSESRAALASQGTLTRCTSPSCTVLCSAPTRTTPSVIVSRQQDLR